MFQNNELSTKLDEISDKLDEIMNQFAVINERLEILDEKICVENNSEIQSGDRKVIPLPLPGDPFEISDAIGKAIIETDAKSVIDMGRVIKFARGLLKKKGKAYSEIELLNAVHNLELFKDQTDSHN